MIAVPSCKRVRLFNCDLDLFIPFFIFHLSAIFEISLVYGVTVFKTSSLIMYVCTGRKRRLVRIRSGNDLKHGQIDVLSYEVGRTEDDRLQRRNIGTMKLFEVELLHHSDFVHPKITQTKSSCKNPGGGDSYMKQTGMLVVSLRGVNFGLWSRLGCSGQSANILSRQGLV